MAPFVWHPPANLVEHANITRFMRAQGFSDVGAFIRRTIEDQEWFWDAVVKDLGIEFSTPYTQVRDTSRGIPWTSWYLGGKLNLATNCLDRHRQGPAADRPALISETEDGRVTTFTFRELAEAVDRCAAGLLAAGLQRGDRVGAYMPMVAEVAIQMFACFKVGAIFVPIFSGFAAPALAERLRDAGARLLFTADET
ncbi:MAG TPA: AMP-binding protein, partial [Gemmatimonadales bacterium]|nr:AMP-binding protein [Gemmatimonadales bacterium]